MKGGMCEAHQVPRSPLNRCRAQWSPPGDNGRTQTTSKSSGLHIKDLSHRTTKAAHRAACEDDSLRQAPLGHPHFLWRASQPSKSIGNKNSNEIGGGIFQANFQAENLCRSVFIPKLSSNYSFAPTGLRLNAPTENNYNKVCWTTFCILS